jgi:colicin import membrane protein
MKKIIVILLLCAPLMVNAQNAWEEKAEETSMQKYLVGVVPEVNGQVVFNKEIKCPGKSKQDIYNKVLPFMKKMVKENGQLEQSRIAMSDSIGNIIVGRYEEWLVFNNKPLSLDRTRLFYNIVCKCSDGSLDVTISNIHYLYDEERDPIAYKAEEWITDRYGLTKNKAKLSRVSGKFRRKTIDRKDYLFGKLESILK